MFDDGALEEALGVLAEDLTRGDHVREGAPRGDVHDGEAGGVAGADDGALSLGHGVGVCVEGGGSSALVRQCRGDDKINDWVQLCVGSLTGAGVVLVDGGRETEAAGEEARGGVDAHDLRWEDVDRSSASVIASMPRFGGQGGRSGSRPVFVRCLRVKSHPRSGPRRASRRVAQEGYVPRSRGNRWPSQP